MAALDAVDRLDALRATGLLDSPSDQIFDDLTALAARLFDVPVALFSLVDDRRQFFKSQIGLAEPWASRRETPLTHSFCQYAVTRGGQLVVTDARNDETLRASRAIDELGVIAYAGVPVHAGGQPIGVVCAIDHAPRAWTDADMALLHRLAAIASREVERRALDVQLAEVTVALREQHELLTAVIDSMDESVVVVDPAGQVLLVNRAAEQTFGAAAVVDAMARSPAETPAALGLLELDGVTPLAPARAPMQRALRGERVRDCELMVRGPGAGAPRWSSVNAAPIHAADGAVRGAVAVGRDVTALKDAQRALERSATRDELTGLYNCRGVYEHAQLALRRAARSGRPLALMFLDLDGLKAINDQQGHAAGDAMLLALADLLRATFRTSDLLGRLGGDEFVVVAVDTDDDPDGARLRPGSRRRSPRPRRPRPSASASSPTTRATAPARSTTCSPTPTPACTPPSAPAAPRAGRRSEAAAPPPALTPRR